MDAHPEENKIHYGPEQKVWTDTLSSIAKSQDGGLLVSPPSEDPLTMYSFEQEPVTTAWYQVPSTTLKLMKNSVLELCMKQHKLVTFLENIP